MGGVWGRSLSAIRGILGGHTTRGPRIAGNTRCGFMTPPSWGPPKGARNQPRPPNMMKQPPPIKPVRGAPVCTATYPPPPCGMWVLTADPYHKDTRLRGNRSSSVMLPLAPFAVTDEVPENK